MGVVQSAELEAEVAARRVAIHALRAETRRLEGQAGTPERDVTIPAGWLPALAEGVAQLICNYEQDEAEERAAGRPVEASREESEYVERVRAFERTIRGVQSGRAYSVSACDGEVLWHGISSAWVLQKLAVEKIPEWTDPPVLRFVAVEEMEALEELLSVLDDLLDRAEGIR